jgi:hypothetical protein
MRGYPTCQVGIRGSPPQSTDALPPAIVKSVTMARAGLHICPLFHVETFKRNQSPIPARGSLQHASSVAHRNSSPHQQSAAKVSTFTASNVSLGGGPRIIHVFHDADMPWFLLKTLVKNERTDSRRRSAMTYGRWQRHWSRATGDDNHEQDRRYDSEGR